MFIFNREVYSMSSMFTTPKDKIIVALDVSTGEEAEKLIQQLTPYVGFFKVGLELTTAIGVPEAVKLVKKSGAKVFLDLKLHDIPSTMKKAALAAEQLGVDILTIHITSGFAAVKEVTQQCTSLMMAGVTLLTSFDNKAAQEIYRDRASQQVRYLASNAAFCGLPAIVCSPAD